MKNKVTDPKEMKKLGVYVTIPFILAVPPIIGWFIGKWLDEVFSLFFLKYIFILLGLIAGFRELYRLIKKFGDDES